MTKPGYTRDSLLKCVLQDVYDDKCKVLIFNDSTSLKIRRIIEDLRQMIPEGSNYSKNQYMMCHGEDAEATVAEIDKRTDGNRLPLLIVNDPKRLMHAYSHEKDGWYTVSVDACIGSPDISSIVKGIEEENNLIDLPMTREVANEYAKILWDMDGADFTLDKPFEVGKNRSPFYIYAELFMGYPELRDKVLDDFAGIAEGLEYDIIASGETRGIPFAQGLAKMLDVPFLYVRKHMKKNNRSRIECMREADVKNKRVLFVSDTIGYGDSTLDFADGIRDIGGTVKDCIVVFDRLQGAKERLKDKHIDLYPLTNTDTLINVGIEEGYISIPEFSEVSLYQRDEEEWHIRNGFEYHKPAKPQKHYLTHKTGNVNHRRFLDAD